MGTPIKVRSDDVDILLKNNILLLYIQYTVIVPLSILCTKYVSHDFKACAVLWCYAVFIFCINFILFYKKLS